MRYKMAVTIFTGLIIAGCGSGASDKSSQIAAALGSTASCSETVYQIVSQINNSKTQIYDCYVGATSKRMCVTQQNGLVHDSTAIVRLLFQGTLAGGKPACLNHA